MQSTCRLKSLSIANKKGVTLVELLIVVAILGILLLILVPQFTRFMEDAKVAKDNAEAESVRNAVEAMLVDPTFSGYFAKDDSITISKDGIAISFAGSGGRDLTICNGLLELLGEATETDADLAKAKLASMAKATSKTYNIADDDANYAKYEIKIAESTGAGGLTYLRAEVKPYLTTDPDDID